MGIQPNGHHQQRQAPPPPKPVRSNHTRHRSGPLHAIPYEEARNAKAASGIARTGLPTGAKGPTSPTQGIFNPRSGQFSQAQAQPMVAPTAFKPSTPPPPYNSQYRPAPEQLIQLQHDQFGQRVQPQMSNNPFAGVNGSPGNARHSASPYATNYSPTLEPRKVSGSPKSQPMSHTATTMSDSSSDASSQDTFVEFMNPNFLFNRDVLAGINLNDPDQRDQWIEWVWEYFRSGGQWSGFGPVTMGWGPDSQGNSPAAAPIYNPVGNGFGQLNGTSISSDIDDGIQLNGTQDVDMMGAFVPFNGRGISSNGRRHSEDAAGMMANGGQWMTTSYQMDMMDNMDTIMATEPIKPNNSSTKRKTFKVEDGPRGFFV